MTAVSYARVVDLLNDLIESRAGDFRFRRTFLVHGMRFVEEHLSLVSVWTEKSTWSPEKRKEKRVYVYRYRYLYVVLARENVSYFFAPNKFTNKPCPFL